MRVFAMAAAFCIAFSAGAAPSPISARSVHMWHPAPGAEWVYGEVTVEKSVPGSYFSVICFSCGYCGIQESYDGRKIAIFSVWDPGDPFDFKAKADGVDEKVRTKNLYVGEGVSISRFGGEGTGGRSLMPFDWKVGETCRFAVHARPDGDHRTAFTCYLFRDGAWFRIATFSTLQTKGAHVIKDVCSFVEDFRRNEESRGQVRRARFTNFFAKPVGGEWTAMEDGRFTADRNPSIMTIDAEVVECGFALATGGDTENKNLKLRTVAKTKIGQRPAECAALDALVDSQRKVTDRSAVEPEAKSPAAELRDRLSSAFDRVLLSKGALPGAILASGGDAVPVVFGKSGRYFDGKGELEIPAMAASSYGRGRVLASGHQAFFTGEAATANREFLRECLVWLAGGKAPSTVYVDSARVGMRDSVARALGKVDVVTVGSYRELGSLPDGAVLVAEPNSHSLEEAAMLSAFVRRGCGALCISVGWGWHQMSGGKSMKTENPFNIALGGCGLYSTELVSAAGDGRTYMVAKGDLPGAVGEDALRLVAPGSGSLSKEVAARCAMVLGELAKVLPDGDESLLPRIKAIAADVDCLPSPERPLTTSNARSRLGMMLHMQEWQENPGRCWPAHPAAAVYPGLPSAGAPRVTRTVDVSLSVPQWHGTGLFAAAGEPLTVALPDGMEKAGLRVRVGTSSCNNTRHAQWLRAPQVSVELPLDRRETTFASPFGGMVYVVVPSGAHRDGIVPVTIGPACPAAWYVEGKTSLESWKAALKSSPSPVAEIESDVIALTVPRETAMNGSDPQEVLDVWRRVLADDAHLTGIPEVRRCKERMCFDVQLCAGYMHNGYPIMLPKHSIVHLLNADTLRKGDHAWGFFHEMGHNHQNDDWTFDGTVEVTVNFFTLYNMERICGKKPMETDKMRDPSVWRNVARWKAAGRPFGEWKSDPWLGLAFFVELQQKYGWEAFEKLFAEYRALPDSERPKTDLEKRRQWCERLSRIVGKDLTEDFSFMLGD